MKVTVACYMIFSSSMSIKEVNEKEAEKALKEINVNVEFREDGV